MSKPRQSKSGSKRDRRRDGKKKKGSKRPHPEMGKLSAGAPTAAQVARGEGTAGILGVASAPREPGGAGVYIRGGSGNRVIGGTYDRARIEGGTGNKITGGVIGALAVQAAGHVVLAGDVIVHGRIAAEMGSTIEAKSAFLGDRFVDGMEIATRDVEGVTSAQIASRDRMVVSARGDAPDRDANHARVGRAVAKELGNRHAVIPEVAGEAGARLRDGHPDVQVDVFLRSEAEDEADDVKLQVVILPAAARQLGEHGAAIDYVLDADAIRAAIAFKEGFAGKDAIDLVISCPFEVSTPFRQTLEAAGPLGFDTLGYSRVWLVDATGWVIVLGKLAAPTAGS